MPLRFRSPAAAGPFGGCVSRDGRPMRRNCTGSSTVSSSQAAGSAQADTPASQARRILGR